MKIFKAITISALMASAAFAQNATLPTAPQPPAIVATSPNATDANSIATTNKVYIDQSGENVNVNIEQTGTGNQFGNVADPIYLRGDNQTIIGIQTGNNNSVLMGIDSSSGSGTDEADVTIRQIGNNNTADIRCGLDTNVNCNSLDMNVKFVGNSNQFTFLGSGTNITTSVDFAGNSNQLTIDALSNNASQTLKLIGDFNTIDITQTGAGGQYGHSAWMDFTGSSNSITTQQYGATSTVINILSVGSNGTYNVKTGQ
jgi:hypothetical protein